MARYSSKIKPVEDFYLQIAVGNVPGYGYVEKFGRNPSIDNGVREDIWDVGGVWVAPTQARLHSLSSTSASDISVGAGAQTVQVYGLDTDGLEINETVAMNGSGSAVTTQAYLRLHRMVVRTAGSAEMNAGNITATASVDGTITAQISACNNQTLMAIYTIPSNKTAYLANWYISMNRAQTTGAIDARLLLRPPNEVFQVKRIIGLISAGNSIYEGKRVPSYEEIPALSDIKIDATPTANSTDVSGGFDLILLEND